MSAHFRCPPSQVPELGLVRMLQAEREYANLFWEILHEMAILGQLPEWVARMDVASHRKFEELEGARLRLDDALAGAIPGFLPARKLPLKAAPFPLDLL